MMVVSRSLSLRAVKCSFCASSVRLMYCAFSLAASFFARVVLPVQGVPVMRMTRLFMGGSGLMEIVIVFVCGLVVFCLVVVVGGLLCTTSFWVCVLGCGLCLGVFGVCVLVVQVVASCCFLCENKVEKLLVIW